MNRRTVLVTVVSAGTAFAGCTNLGSGDTPTGTSPMTPDSLVRGTIVFRPRRPDLSGATVYVRLEDISRADAPAQVVSEEAIHDPTERLTADGLPFTLSGSAAGIEPQGRYSVAAHVDMDGDGDVSLGDYVSTEINPVLTHDNPDTVTVTVEPVD